LILHCSADLLHLGLQQEYRPVTTWLSAAPLGGNNMVRVKVQKKKARTSNVGGLDGQGRKKNLLQAFTKVFAQIASEIHSVRDRREAGLFRTAVIFFSFPPLCGRKRRV